MTESKRQNPKEVMNAIKELYAKSITQIENYRKYAKPQTVKVGDWQDERTIQEIEKDKQAKYIQEMELKASDEVRHLIEEYEKSENDFFALSGENITPDYELFKAGIVAAEQVKAFQHKYKDNMTMLSLINNYAESHNLSKYELQPTADRLTIINRYNDLTYPRYKDYAEQNRTLQDYDFNRIADTIAESQMKGIYENGTL